MWSILANIKQFLKYILNYYVIFPEVEDNNYEQIKTRNLITLTQSEREKFLDSFDHVIFDCDGVLWRNNDPIPGVKKSLELLAARGKDLHFVTNNSVKTFENYRMLFRKVGVDIKHENLSYPSKTVVNYLSSLNFNKSVFVIGSSMLLADLKAAGISCVTAANESPEELNWFLENTMDDENIGAVFVDFDINFNYLKLHKALSLLKRPDVLFLVGSVDNDVTVLKHRKLIGPGAFIKILSDYSGRQPMLMGKPGNEVKDLIMKQFNITKPERTLFIGDSMDTDMAFADLCRFQKLLVFTGVSSPRDVIRNRNISLNPHYTLPSLTEMALVLQNNNFNKSASED